MPLPGALAGQSGPCPSQWDGQLAHRGGGGHPADRLAAGPTGPFPRQRHGSEPPHPPLRGGLSAAGGGEAAGGRRQWRLPRPPRPPRSGETPKLGGRGGLSAASAGEAERDHSPVAPNGASHRRSPPVAPPTTPSPATVGRDAQPTRARPPLPRERGRGGEGPQRRRPRWGLPPEVAASGASHDPLTRHGRARRPTYVGAAASPPPARERRRGTTAPSPAMGPPTGGRRRWRLPRRPRAPRARGPGHGVSDPATAEPAGRVTPRPRALPRRNALPIPWEVRS